MHLEYFFSFSKVLRQSNFDKSNENFEDIYV